MLVIMVVIFAVCWFPFNFLNILRDLHWDDFIRPHFSFIFLIVHLISMTATCWNPILYAWMNDSFREGFVKAIPFLRFKVKPNGGVRAMTEGKPGDCTKAPIGRHIADDCSPPDEKQKFPSDGVQKIPENKCEEKKSLVQSPEREKVEIILADDAEMHDNYLL
ncbi:hypothetical protein Y032_0146g2530 [Ancylostoma ceylanicum]|uniref:G-protein coupled receptors family 1 profile domain-containing protein n=4 Tax=Ancylostoma ceylanicum TaxID=53326 RepID=A0A016T2D4_9BILA|nr:hypothetical protein Y032_0146g2530 [Ancylostoma ceylanicum]